MENDRINNNNKQLYFNFMSSVAHAHVLIMFSLIRSGHSRTQIFMSYATKKRITKTITNNILLNTTYLLVQLKK